MITFRQTSVKTALFSCNIEVFIAKNNKRGTAQVGTPLETKRARQFPNLKHPGNRKKIGKLTEYRKTDPKAIQHANYVKN